jgi:uncharacterized membrane protein YccF (DUF307 family)
MAACHTGLIGRKDRHGEAAASVMRVILNIIWLVLCGIWMATA